MKPVSVSPTLRDTGALWTPCGHLRGPGWPWMQKVQKVGYLDAPGSRKYKKSDTSVHTSANFYRPYRKSEESVQTSDTSPDRDPGFSLKRPGLVFGDLWLGVPARWHRNVGEPP